MAAPFPPVWHSPLLKKGALIPLWGLQLLVMFGIIGIQVYLGTKVFGGIGGPTMLIFFSLCAFCAILTLVEIALFAGHKLRPLAYLLMQLAKLIIWLTLLGLWVAGVSTGQEITGQQITMTTYFVVQLVATVLLVLAFLGPFIYACVIYHRHRRARSQHRQRLFSLEEGKYPEVSDEKTLERQNVLWPATITSGKSPCTSDFHHGHGGMSKYPYASASASALNSPTLVEFDAGTSPMMRDCCCRQELGDEGWVKELDSDKGVHELSRASREIYELAAVRTPKVRSRKASRDRLGQDVRPMVRSRRGSRDGGVSPKTRSRKGSRDELGAAVSPRGRSRKMSWDELTAIGRPRTRCNRVNKEVATSANARNRKASREELAAIKIRKSGQGDIRRTMW